MGNRFRGILGWVFLCHQGEKEGMNMETLSVKIFGNGKRGKCFFSWYGMLLVCRWKGWNHWIGLSWCLIMVCTRYVKHCDCLLYDLFTPRILKSYGSLLEHFHIYYISFIKLRVSWIIYKSWSFSCFHLDDNWNIESWHIFHNIPISFSLHCWNKNCYRFGNLIFFWTWNIVRAIYLIDIHFVVWYGLKTNKFNMVAYLLCHKVH